MPVVELGDVDQSQSFEFRLRFKIPEERRFLSDDTKLTFELPGLPTTVSIAVRGGEGKIADASQLVMKCSGFATERDALEAGQRLADAIRVTPVLTNTAVDLGQNLPDGWRITDYFAKKVREESEAEGNPVQLHNDTHGLMVFKREQGFTMLFSSRSSNLQVCRNAEEFVSAIQEFYGFPTADHDLRLPLDLFSAAAFEASNSAQFIGLVTVIESLSGENISRSDSIQKLVDGFTDAAKAHHYEDEVEKNRFLQAVAGLRTESITFRCRKVVKEAGQDDKFFKECYGERSELLHNGKKDVSASLNDLRELVKNVLVHRIAQARK